MFIHNLSYHLGA